MKRPAYNREIIKLKKLFKTFLQFIDANNKLKKLELEEIAETERILTEIY